MDKTAKTISYKSDEPSYDQDYGYVIKEISHDRSFKGEKI